MKACENCMNWREPERIKTQQLLDATECQDDLGGGGLEDRHRGRIESTGLLFQVQQSGR